MSVKKNVAVALVMGSQSDWDTMKLASEILNDFKVSYETKIISAHRTPERLFSYAKTAKKRGIKANKNLAAIFYSSTIDQ